MPYIQLNDTQIPLRAGAMRVGSGADAEIRVPGLAEARVLAVVEVAPDASTAIRRADAAADVRVNDVQLGAEPVPLLHGDKIEVGGHELLFGDDRKGGSTQFVPSMAAMGAGTPGRAPGRPTAATGGRLVSLVDGREYEVPAGGVVLGRDAGCDVVIPSSEVSRRHAAIAPGADGYVVRDTSTNGIWVNGVRVEGMATLGRGDVLRLGSEEFRFYADAAPAAAPRPAAAMAGAGSASVGVPEPVHVPAPGPARPERPEPVPAPSPIPAPTPAPVPREVPAPQPSPAPQPAPAPGPVAAPAFGAARGALATLEVLNEGLLRGRRYELRHPLANVGRGEHNDVVIPEESVSDSHAKLQKRDGRWFVVDMQSTNGTYVAGQRLTAERELAPGAELRFGGVKLLFHPVSDAPDEGKGTRVIAGASLDPARAASPSRPAAPKRPAPAPAPAAPAPKQSSPALIVLLVLLVVAAAVYFLTQAR